MDIEKKEALEIIERLKKAILDITESRAARIDRNDIWEWFEDFKFQLGDDVIFRFITDEELDEAHKKGDDKFKKRDPNAWKKEQEDIERLIKTIFGEPEK